ncbi:MAG: YCF48-related protein [Flavobacteriales bacterium]
MHRHLLLALLLICGARGTAQWNQVTSNTTHELYGVHFPDDETGYAVGAAGTVIKSTDRGFVWSTLTFPSTGDLQSVWFLTASEGFVAGDSGIFHTDNGGNTWAPVSTPVILPWRHIRFISTLIGFCGGGNFGDGAILRTQDGGDTWAVVYSGDPQPISAIDFPTPSVGYAVVMGYSWSVLKTTDGGDTWNTVGIQPIVNQSTFEAVHFIDENTGFLGGWYIAAFIRTDDGAVSWYDLSNGQFYHLYDLAFASATQALAVGWYGSIHHMYNGADWVDESWTGSNTVFYAADMLDDTTAIVVGSSGTLLRWAAGSTGVNIVVSPSATITLHPSPATDWIMLDAAAPLPVNARFELRDATGRLVKSAPARANIRIGMTDISEGTYLWRCVGPVGAIASGTVVVGSR